MKQWTHEKLKRYCIDRLFEIEQINHYSHTPSAFVCIVAFISFLSELAYGTNEYDNKAGKRYRDFIERYLPKYRAYKEDFYSTFRCGIVHSMTLYKPVKNKRLAVNKVDLPKIVITHDLNYAKLNEIEKYKKNGFDAIVIYAFDLCREIRDAIDVMFDSKEPNNPAYGNAIDFVKYQKPIGAL